jgi:N-acetylgalactosamine kinase
MAETGSMFAESVDERLLTAAAWRALVRTRPAAIRAALEATYGGQPDFIATRERQLARLLEVFEASFGDLPVVVARAPGRVNLMGRHVDHRGGYINTIAIHNDVWIVASRRDDGRILLRDLDPQFDPHDIDPGRLWAAAGAQPWREFVNGPEVTEHLAATRGAWTNYGLGAYLRLRCELGDRLAGGFNAVVWGDVPLSVGLSSSSSVFVATAIALARLAGTAIEPERLIQLCGEGEWFVGTRGGAGDHASMVYGRRGMISQIGFFPIHLARRAPVPAGLEIILCNSNQRAEKSRHARDRFNARVAAYEIGLALLRLRCPDLTRAVEHLRDLNPEKTGFSVDRIYEALKSIPVWMTREEVHELLHEQTDRIEAWFATHGDRDGGYPLRAVLLFGIAECERSRHALEAFSHGDIERIRRYFAVSHDGDRVTRADRGDRRVWTAEVSDWMLDRLIRLARSADAADREKAALANQAGAYGCSTPEIDEMVDIAMATEGAIGVQLVGAGLGGSIAVLAHKGHVAEIEKALTAAYYEPHDLAPEVHVFQPAAGAACLEPPR